MTCECEGAGLTEMSTVDILQLINIYNRAYEQTHDDATASMLYALHFELQQRREER